MDLINLSRRGPRCALILVLAVVLCSWSGEGRAANPLPPNPRYVFQQVGSELGLATLTVVSLLQDESGFIWIGAIDGLYRYDGRSVDRFGEEEGLPSTYVEQLVLSPDGGVWVLTRGGLSRFDGHGFVRLETDLPELSSHKRELLPQRVAFDDRNRAYVALSNGVARIDPVSPHHVTLWGVGQGLDPRGVSAVVRGPSGEIWFASGNRVGFINPQAKEVVVLPESSELPNEMIYSVGLNAVGQLYVRTKTRLLRKDPMAKRFVADDEGLPPAAVRYCVISFDRDGHPLLPSIHGLFYKSGGGWMRVAEEQGLSTGGVFSVMEDHEGALWLGLGGAGVNRWPGRRSWRAWTAKEGLPDNAVWGSLRDAENRLWVGTGDGVGIWDPNKQSWSVRRQEDGVVGRWVLNLGVDGAGWIWGLSPRTGLTRFHPETFVPEGVPLPEEIEDGPLALESAPNGTIWVGGGGYLLRAEVTINSDGGAPVASFERIPLPADAPDCAQSLSVASNEVVWMGGLSGLCRYERGEWQVFSSRNGFPIDTADQVAAVDDEEVWFGNRRFQRVSRLTLADGRPRVKSFGISDGLPSNTVYMVGFDQRGSIWVGGNAGVSRIDREENVRVYTRADGLIWDDLSGDGFLADAGGAVFIATSRGLAHFDPFGESSEMPKPKTVIKSAMLGGEEITGRSGVEVPVERSSFIARLAGLTFRNSEGTRFEYQLEGLEDVPVLTSAHEVRYPRLPPGDYLFKVRCQSSSGKWSEDHPSIAFHVETPWWQTWWARALAVAGMLSLTFPVTWLRTRRLNMEKKRLAQAVLERSAELTLVNEELARTNGQLEGAIEEIKSASFVDPLTGARNRAYFSTQVEEEAKQLASEYDRRVGADMLLMLVDVDDFGRVNDTWGYATGDRVLVELAERLQGHLRPNDSIVRWSGEQFMFVCRGATSSYANELARKVLETVGRENFRVLGERNLELTCSVGWAVFPWIVGEPTAVSLTQVIEMTEQAVEVAKAGGKNQSVGTVPYGATDGRSVAGIAGKSIHQLDGRSLQLVRNRGRGRT